MCKRKKYILFEQGDFEPAFYLTPGTKFVLLKIQKNEPQKAKDKTWQKMFTGIGIMNSSVKNSALTDTRLILH